MRYGFILLLVLFGTANAVFAQDKGKVQGLAFDSLNNRAIPDATITVLLKKDSSLVSFGMTDAAGRFEITGLKNGDYRLLVTHVAYHNKNQFFTIDDNNRQVQLGNIKMDDKTQVLDEVVVTSEAPPVTMVGDTIQYNAGSFKTQPNASVEQLLKRMPGMEVDKDGTIRAQGQKVNKVLVDGKEFFGNDPKIATKNLPADAIDKVQVYDKQSDQAAMTGFDDGNGERTINLKLKADKKKGMFGKIMGGAGTRDTKEGRFNINSFKGARQASVIGMGNNTNTEGFSFMDMMSFTGELSRLMRGGGGTISSNDPAAAMLAGAGNTNQGIRTIWGGGLNYNDMFGTKTDFRSNYFYNHVNPKTTSTRLREYLLPDSSYFNRQTANTDYAANSHRLNFIIDQFIDTFHSIKISPSIGYQHSDNRSRTDFKQWGSDGVTSNDGYTYNRSNNKSFNFNNEILFRKKFRRRGRTLSLSLLTTFNDNNGTGNLETVNNFYDRLGAKLRADSINQFIENESRLNGYNAKLVYTEPLFRSSLLELSASNARTKNVSNKTTYDFNKGNDKFDRFNDSLSNDFLNIYANTQAGARVRTQKSKYNYFVGLNWQYAYLEGKVVSGIKDSIINKNFNNLLPSARFQYKFTRYKSITADYQTYTTQPTVSQLQPVPDISSPMLQREGNPNLKQEYSHNVRLNYNSINPFRNKNFFATFSATKTNNKIVNADSLLASGTRVTKPVNVDGVYNVNGNVSTGIPVKALKTDFRLGATVAYNRGVQFTNGAENLINTYTVGPRLNIDINPNDKIDLMFGTRLNYNRSTYSLDNKFNNTYFSQYYEAEFNWQMPAGFYFSTDFNYTINNQLSSGFNARIPLWGASISKQFLKNNRGELKIRVNDILNKNISVDRTSNQNYIEDRLVNTLSRYGLISFTYSLSKTGLGGGGSGPKVTFQAR